MNDLTDRLARLDRADGPTPSDGDVAADLVRAHSALGRPGTPAPG